MPCQPFPLRKMCTLQSSFKALSSRASRRVGKKKKGLVKPYYGHYSFAEKCLYFGASSSFTSRAYVVREAERGTFFAWASSMHLRPPSSLLSLFERRSIVIALQFREWTTTIRRRCCLPKRVTRGKCCCCCCWCVRCP